MTRSETAIRNLISSLNIRGDHLPATTKGVAVVGMEGPIPSDQTCSAGRRETRSHQSGQLLYGRSYLIGESLMVIAPIPIIGSLLNRPTLKLQA